MSADFSGFYPKEIEEQCSTYYGIVRHDTDGVAEVPLILGILIPSIADNLMIPTELL